jgi:hypothetical protein
MAFAECYLDETETVGDRPLFAIAGALFRGDGVTRLNNEWLAMLGKWSLPYFHMTDCANHQGIFSHLSAEETDLAARQAILIIRETVSAFVYASVELSHHKEVVAEAFGPYEWCAMSILPNVAKWCDRNPDVDSIHYYFEDGAKGKSNARECIVEMLEVEDFKLQCRYSGLSFVPKQKYPCVQAADMLAWHTGKDSKKAFAGAPRRKDFAALIEGIPAYGGHWSLAELQIIALKANYDL